MNAPKRWIVLVPTALSLFAVATGCKTGSNRFCCKQTSCSSTCTTTACGAKSDCCLKKNAPCASAATACATNAGCRTSCKTGRCNLLNCLCRDKQVSCSSCSVGQCKTGSSCLCKTKTSCGAVACGTGCSVQLGKPIAQPPAKEQVSPPFEEMEPEKEKTKPMPKKAKTPAKPMPIPKEATLRPTVPLPAPPIDTDTAEENTNPFLRVSRTQEVPAEREILPAPPAAKGYSKAWADALGLPEQQPEPIPQYRP